MKLDFVEVAGFRGFRDRTRFDIPAGFVVLVGRNGAGKSTVLDAIDFALTGTINKFDVRTAKGGGLEDHIWWVGDGQASERYVSVGFVDDNEERFVIRRDWLNQHANQEKLISRLYAGDGGEVQSVETLMQTSLIRDERIVAFSLDLAEQQRFAAVRAAIGGIIGPDYSERTSAVSRAAVAARDAQQRRFDEAQAELGRSLSALTEARSVAERSSDIADAIQILDSLQIALAEPPGERAEAIRNIIVDKAQALHNIDVARRRAIELMPEYNYVNSAAANKEAEALQLDWQNAVRDRQAALDISNLALRALQSEQEADTFAAHMSALLEHGHALGLQDGHCPLCNAVRTNKEFSSAIASARSRLADRGKRLAAASEAFARAQASLKTATEKLEIAQAKLAEFTSRRQRVLDGIAEIRTIYEQNNFNAALAEDPISAETLWLQEQDKLVRLERALFIVEASSAIDQVRNIEAHSNRLRASVEQEAAKVVEAERAVDLAKQIEASAKQLTNQILTEQFDTVMPLLKELYRRLRPHAGWTEIESDFGGKVRGSLNFTVGGGHNVQFLFSSGQRRAAGLAFLLAVHLSRRWCKLQTLLLDDPVQHIDDYRALNLVEVLSAIRRTGRQVIVAVEDEALADVLCRRLRSVESQIGRRFNLRASATGTAEIASIDEIYAMPREVLWSAASA
jgi:chromosome segregation protein